MTQKKVSFKSLKRRVYIRIYLIALRPKFVESGFLTTNAYNTTVPINIQSGKKVEKNPRVK